MCNTSKYSTQAKFWTIAIGNPKLIERRGLNLSTWCEWLSTIIAVCGDFQALRSGFTLLLYDDRQTRLYLTQYILNHNWHTENRSRRSQKVIDQVDHDEHLAWRNCAIVFLLWRLEPGRPVVMLCWSAARRLMSVKGLAYTMWGLNCRCCSVA